MTTPHERTRALLQTKKFLGELIDSDKTPGIPEEIRRQAKILLRHYPGIFHLELASKALPEQYGPITDLL